ncbi:MAG: 4-alpha-glucanotransferase [Eubacteriales bacterium]|nr:4-alpha-glucanotransferase [Eubacteriales bacterium]
MRKSGILLHITSLPTKGGIGTIGKEAYDFVDFLNKSGMSVWQILPVSPTGFGDSPYQSVSTYAGNPLLIDLELLKEEGLIDSIDPMEDEEPDRVDYGRVVEHKTQVLKEAFKVSYKKCEKEVQKFIHKNAWVKDYALFSAVKEHFGMISWMSWPDEDIRMRRRDALNHYKNLLKESVNYYIFVQYLFFKQWFALKNYANKKGVRLFGDMPIYVAEDSADVWTNPKVFQLDKNRRPTFIAGVPPDYFSMDGQRWGNPLYDWEYLKETNFRWWIKRLKAMNQIYDILRVDHFIGFANYYSIPADEETAKNGKWKIAPGKAFFKAVKQELPNMDIVAEDLGAVNKRVQDLLKYCGYPGMKVLSFAFSGDPHDPHLPQNYEENFVVYTGTHDNTTAEGWYQAASEGQRALADKLLRRQPWQSFSYTMCREAMMSKADTCVLPMQDILSLPDTARMNIPSTIGGLNWRWRLLPGQFNDTLADKILSLNIMAGRAFNETKEQK